MEGGPAHQSSAENPRAGRPAGQTEEREAAKAVPAGDPRGCPAEAETEGITQTLAFKTVHSVFGLFDLGLKFQEK